MFGNISLTRLKTPRCVVHHAPTFFAKLLCWYRHTPRVQPGILCFLRSNCSSWCHFSVSFLEGRWPPVRLTPLSKNKCHYDRFWSWRTLVSSIRDYSLRKVRESHKENSIPQVFLCLAKSISLPHALSGKWNITSTTISCPPGSFICTVSSPHKLFYSHENHACNFSGPGFHFSSGTA